MSFPPMSRVLRGAVGRGPGKRPERIGNPGWEAKGFRGLPKGFGGPPPLRWGLVCRALARSKRNISNWEPPEGLRGWPHPGKGFRPPRDNESSLMFLKHGNVIKIVPNISRF